MPGGGGGAGGTKAGGPSQGSPGDLDARLRQFERVKETQCVESIHTAGGEVLAIKLHCRKLGSGESTGLEIRRC